MPLAAIASTNILPIVLICICASQEYCSRV
jgi:hypothetical protein